MNKELLTKHNYKKEMCRGWKQSQVTEGEPRRYPGVWGWESQSLAGVDSGETTKASMGLSAVEED